MSLDLTVLRLLRVREKFARLRRVVPDAALQAHTIVLLKDYARFFKEFEAEAEFDFQKFWPLFRMWHPNLKDEAVAVFNTVLRQIDSPLDDGVEQGIAARLVAADCAEQLTTILTRWNDGDEVDLHREVQAVTEYYEAAVNKRVTIPWVEANIDDLLDDDANDVGLHWRLDCLNNSMRPLRPGDFGIIAMRPDRGKTSLLTSELTFMASQIDTLFPGENRHILWFNNEGPGKRIVGRKYQSALNMSVSEMIEFRNKHGRGQFNELYEQAIGGRTDIIRILDVHDYWSHDIEDILKNTRPAVVVFDMVDNIRFGGSVGNNGQRTDQLLEAMYQWARVLGVKYDTAVLATSQISADGDNVAYPTLPMLKDSKTGKQGAADFIITGGCLNDPMFQNTRFIGMTKNKLHRSGGPKDPRCEVVFDSERGRFNMPGA